ncbi:MAG: response regulator [Candidatus Tectimicrobiota bacterium]
MPKKILVVDDEPSFCEVLRDLLEGNGYHVVEAHNGKEALKAYRRERPDVMLLDVLMPGRSGLRTFRELRALDPEARVIMVSVLHEEALAKQAMDAGAIDYIAKPINLNDLEEALMANLAMQDGDV